MPITFSLRSSPTTRLHPFRWMRSVVTPRPQPTSSTRATRQSSVTDLGIAVSTRLAPQSSTAHTRPACPTDSQTSREQLYAHGTHAGPAGGAAHAVPRQKPQRPTLQRPDGCQLITSGAASTLPRFIPATR